MFVPLDGLCCLSSRRRGFVQNLHKLSALLRWDNRVQAEGAIRDNFVYEVFDDDESERQLRAELAAERAAREGLAIWGSVERRREIEKEAKKEDIVEDD